MKARLGDIVIYVGYEKEHAAIVTEVKEDDYVALTIYKGPQTLYSAHVPYSEKDEQATWHHRKVSFKVNPTEYADKKKKNK